MCVGDVDLLSSPPHTILSRYLLGFLASSGHEFISHTGGDNETVVSDVQATIYLQQQTTSIIYEIQVKVQQVQSQECLDVCATYSADEPTYDARLRSEQFRSAMTHGGNAP